MATKFGLVLLLVTMAGVASAHEDCKSEKFFFSFFDSDSCARHHEPKTVAAPEIDPGSAMAGLTLMAGGLAVLRGRRAKNVKA